MAPKKKGGKKQADDWEAELGETVDPIAEATEAAKKADQDNDDAEGANGAAPSGLLAALRKNKDKRAKKGKATPNDFVDGEDPEAAVSTPPATDLDAKAPAEATFDDDEDDIFSGPVKKGKGGKKQPEQTAEPADNDDEEGGLKSKKEKEREKKEREKARKKEQVRLLQYPTMIKGLRTDNFAGSQEKDHHPCPSSSSEARAPQSCGRS